MARLLSLGTIDMLGQMILSFGRLCTVAYLPSTAK
jgi:hypothetical protein